MIGWRLREGRLEGFRVKVNLRNGEWEVGVDRGCSGAPEGIPAAFGNWKRGWDRWSASALSAFSAFAENVVDQANPPQADGAGGPDLSLNRGHGLHGFRIDQFQVLDLDQ